MINAYKTSVTKQKVSRSAHMMLFSVIKTKLYCLRREYVWVCVYALSNASILIMNINHCMLWNKSNRYLADFHSSFAFSLVFVLFFSFCALFRLQFWATHKKSIKKQIKFNHNRTTETRALYKRNRSRFFAFLLIHSARLLLKTGKLCANFCVFTLASLFLAKAKQNALEQLQISATKVYAVRNSIHLFFH